MRHARAGLIGEVLSPQTIAIVTGAALAAAAGLVVSTAPGSVPVAIGVAVLGIVCLLRWPAFTLLAALVVCQELEASSGFGAGGSGLLFIGHQLYFKTFSRISLLTLTAVVAAVRVIAIDPPRRPRLTAVSLVALMGFWYAATVWLDGESLTSAVNQDARFALLFVLAFVVGASAQRRRQWRAHAIGVMQGLFTVMALIGAYLAATGQGQAQTGLDIIFYDAALGAVAGAVVLAVALAPRQARTWQVWWLGAAALIVVVLSARRNVWAAMIVALLVGVAVARDRVRLVLRGLAVVAAILIAVAIFAPSVLTEIGHQLSAIWEATQGTAADNSTQGHLSDITVGLRAVLAHPISGIGAGGHLAGLVVEEGGPLYIHNQILESWLRFGVFGGVLMIVVQATLVGQGIRVLRRRADDITVTWAAMFLIMAPVSMLTAPFFTETQRWPALAGLAAGLVAARRRSESTALSPAAAEPRRLA
ncbi:MAG: O-antigen ligase family protein [Solirubrobacteraceae bacterium]